MSTKAPIYYIEPILFAFHSISETIYEGYYQHIKFKTTRYFYLLYLNNVSILETYDVLVFEYYIFYDNDVVHLYVCKVDVQYSSVYWVQ